MTYPEDTHTKMVYNSQLKCKVENCKEHRSRFSGFCNKHTRNNHLWGSPLGSCVNDSDLTYHWDQIERILQANPDHNGVKSAEEWFKRAMIQGHLNRDIGMSSLIQPTRHWARMYDQGVTPRDCLVTAASVMALGAFCFPYYGGKGLIKSDRHLKYVLGYKVIKLTKFTKGEKWVTGKERRLMAETIMRGVGALLVSLSAAVDKMEDATREHRISLKVELKIPSSSSSSTPTTTNSKGRNI